MPDEPNPFFVEVRTLRKAFRNLVQVCLTNGWTFEATRELVYSKIPLAIPDPGEPGHDVCWTILRRVADDELYRTHHALNPES